MPPSVTGSIRAICRIISAICEHIISGQVLSCGCVFVRIDEAADQGIVIAALEVIEAGFGIVVIAAIAQGVDCGHGAGGGIYLAVGVVGIGSYPGSGRIDKVHDITLEVGDVVVGRAVIGQGEGAAAGVVGKIPGIRTVCLLQQPTAGIHIAVCFRSNSLAGTDTVQVIGIGNACVRAGGGGEAPAVRPGEVPPGAVIIADGVAALDGTRDGFGGGVIGLALVGDQLAVEDGQQVGPPDVGVGVGMGLGILAFDEPGGQIAGLIVVVSVPEASAEQSELQR